jgi:DNA-binding phage protein
VNALKSDLGFVILFGYKWSNEKHAKIISIDKRSLRAFDDSKLLKKASRLLEQADITVAHFGSVFDRRFIQGRLLINKLPPIPPTKMRDTCMIARSVANFSSNRLKHLAKILSFRHQKLENNWPEAWFKVMQGDMKHLRAMAEYCKGDVLALEELYYALRAFDNPHPRLYMDRSKCGKCGGPVEYRGFAYVGTNRYRRWRCKSGCGWGRDTNKAA